MRTVWLILILVACGSSSPPPAPPPFTSTKATGEHVPRPATPAPLPSPYPPTERRPTTDTYANGEVVDDYRWLEDAKDPNVLAWIAAQNQLAGSRLDTLPDRAKIRQRVSQLLSNTGPDYRDVIVTGAGVLALEQHPPKPQPLLVALTDPAKPATEHVVLDPSELDPSGKTTIDFFVPSRDGTKVGVSLSSSGTEIGDLHVYDVATGKALPDSIARVNSSTAGGSIAWNADGSGFWYTRYPRKGERSEADLGFYQQVYFHKLGTPTAVDSYVFGKDLPRTAEISLKASPDGRTILATVENGDGGEFAFYAIDARRGAVPLFRFGDKMVKGSFGPDGVLYLISHRDAPKGAIWRLAEPYTTSKPALLVPEGDGVINDLAVTASHLYLVEMLGGPSRLRSFTLTAGNVSSPEVIATPYPVSEIAMPRPIGVDDLLYRTQSYTTTPGWFRYVAKSRHSTPTALIQPMGFAMNDVDVVRETCTSADGTAVPLNILHKHGIALDGSHPALLIGYGGYNFGLTPRLNPVSRMWIDQDGIYAVANLRGGNEFGEAWHEAGRLTNKQHVFDDFYACARTLTDKGYTRSERLAIGGSSNGGLLMGASLVQHPEMYRVVVSCGGIYDMLRAELTVNGAFNVTEYGTVKEPALFRALYAYSPYHHVVEGTAYPAVLLMSGANDPRVDPYNSRKMAARLQATSSSNRPILLRVSDNVGHGGGTPLGVLIDEMTDRFTFIMSELGMHYRE